MKKHNFTTEACFNHKGIDYRSQVSFVFNEFPRKLEMEEDPRFYITGIELAEDVVPALPLQKADDDLLFDLEDHPEILETCAERIFEYLTEKYALEDC